MRSFIAIPLPDPLRAAIADGAAPFRDRWNAAVTWVPPANYHVTLKFLGGADPSHLWSALGNELRTQTPFAVSLAGWGAFPALPTGRVLWMGLDDAKGALSSLVTRIEDAAERCDIPREARTFSAHITLGRCRQEPVNAQVLSSFLAPRGTLPVQSIVLYESHLSREGSQYIERGRIGFTTPV